jgi:hypothetical protein
MSCKDIILFRDILNRDIMLYKDTFYEDVLFR